MMKAAILESPQRTVVHEVPTPDILPGEVLVKVMACGVCLSEFDKWEGTRQGLLYPILMGHESSGIVARVGHGVKNFKDGDLVAVMPTAPGPYTQYVNGGFAQYLAAPAERLALIPENVSFHAALGEPIACVASAFERSLPFLGRRAAVIGCGFMGLMLVQLLASQGAGEILAVDLRPDALEKALQMGATRACAPDDLEVNDRCLDWKQFGHGFDLVFEVTGAQAALTLAGEMVGVHGVLAIVGFHTGAPRNVNVMQWNIKAITVINAHERRNEKMMNAMRAGLELVSCGSLRMEELVTHFYPLDNVDQAFKVLKNKPSGFIKAVVLPWGTDPDDGGADR